VSRETGSQLVLSLGRVHVHRAVTVVQTVWERRPRLRRAVNKRAQVSSKSQPSHPIYISFSLVLLCVARQKLISHYRLVRLAMSTAVRAGLAILSVITVSQCLSKSVSLSSRLTQHELLVSCSA